LAAFAFSAVTGCVAGALFVQLAGSAFPEQFDVGASISLIVIPIVGGRGWRWAPIAGAIIVIGGPEYFRFLAEYRLVAYGSLVTLLALFAPGGLREVAHVVLAGARRLRPAARP
jgi:branched-chain amino acid transport system permease protein